MFGNISCEDGEFHVIFLFLFQIWIMKVMHQRIVNRPVKREWRTAVAVTAWSRGYCPESTNSLPKLTAAHQHLLATRFTVTFCRAHTWPTASPCILACSSGITLVSTAPGTRVAQEQAVVFSIRTASD